MAFRDEQIAEFVLPATEDTPKREPLVGVFKVEDSDGNVLFEGVGKIVTVGADDMIRLKAAISVDDAAVKLKVHQPLATLNALMIQNVSHAASTIAVSPGASNPLTLPNALGGTSPTISLLLGDVLCEYSKAGQAVDSTHKSLTFTPTFGGILLVAYGGA